MYGCLNLKYFSSFLNADIFFIRCTIEQLFIWFIRLLFWLIKLLGSQAVWVKRGVWFSCLSNIVFNRLKSCINSANIATCWGKAFLEINAHIYLEKWLIREKYLSLSPTFNLYEDCIFLCIFSIRSFAYLPN